MLHCSLRSALTIGALSIASAILPSISSAATVATFPTPATLENIVIDPAGDLFVTAINNGTIYRVTPSGTSNVFGQIPAPNPAVGIARDFDGSILTSSGSNVYRFDANGSLSSVTTVAGAAFLNGVTLFSPGMFLVADSTAGVIWRVDARTGQSQAWSTDPSLGIAPGGMVMVGANGVKIFNGNVYVSNSSSGSILRIPILANGQAGTASIYATNLFVDDFAIASDGTLFGATQFGNSVVRLAPDATRTTIATAADGLLGDAAIAFGRTAADNQDIYVINNGGAFANLPGGQQDGSIVRLNVGVTGAIPEFEAVPEPQTIGVMACGLGAILLLRRRC